MAASSQGHVQVVRFLLGHPIAKTTINHGDVGGQTALLLACYWGRGGVARALLGSGADCTIARGDDLTPMAIAKMDPDLGDTSAEGRRECVAALEVRS
jgi:ankyrin repeat protein